MPLWAVAFVGVVLGASIGLVARWVETRNEKEADFERAVLISTADYRELLLAQATLTLQNRSTRPEEKS